MLRLSEEQRAILCCYSGTREEIIKKLIIAIPFIEDSELRELSGELLMNLEKMDDEISVEVSKDIIFDNYHESDIDDVE